LLVGALVHDLQGRVVNIEPGIIWHLNRLAESQWGQARSGSSGKKQPGSTVLLGDVRAAALDRRIHDTLSQWATKVAEHCAVPFMPLRSVAAHFIGPLPAGWRRLPPDYRVSSADMVRWLADHVTAVMAEPDANEFYDAMTTAVAEIRRIIDPASPVLIGLCPTVIGADGGRLARCSAPIYGQRDDAYLRCRRCRQVHAVADLYSLTADRIRGELLSASQMWHAMHLAGVRTGSRSTFFKLLATRVTPHSYGGGQHQGSDTDRSGDGSCERRRSGRPLYRYDDVLAVLQPHTA